MSSIEAIPPLPTRREILAAGLGGCAACLGLAGCASTSPAVNDPSKGDAASFPPGPTDAGPVAQYATPGLHAQFASRGFFLLHTNHQLVAISSVCTHKRVILNPGPADIGCPRHGSLFTLDGELLKGPARLPLPRHPIRLDDQRHVIVDTSISFDAADRSRPDAVIPV